MPIPPDTRAPGDTGHIADHNNIADALTALTASGALAAQKASNLSDLASPSAARTNLGLGSAATQSSTAFDASGAASAAQSAAIAASLPTMTQSAASGTGTLALNTVTTVTAATTATMTLPSATAGALIVVEREAASTANVAVTGNIRGVASTTITLSLASESEMFLGTGGSWWPIGGHKTLASLQALFAQAANNLSDLPSPSAALGNINGAGKPKTTDCVFFVSVNGSDSNDGLSWGSAFLTVQHAISALPANGGRIFLGSGTFSTASQIVLDGLRNVIIEGTGGRTGGAGAGTILVYTGTAASFISAQSSYGCRLLGLYIEYTNASFTGNLVDARNVSGSDTAYFLAENCILTGSGTSSAAGLIALDKCNSSEIANCAFSGAQAAILGRSSGGYSNAIRVRGNHFVGLTTCPIVSSGQAWLIDCNTFEPLQGRTDSACGTTSGSPAVTDTAVLATDAGKPVSGAGIPAGTVINSVSAGASFTMSANATATASVTCAIGYAAGAYSYGTGQAGNGVTFLSNWFGDSSGGGTWITWGGNNLVVRGNYIAGDAATTGIAVTSSSCFGIEIASNQFATASKAIDLGATSGHTNFAVMFNVYTSVATKINATTWPTGGIHYDGGNFRVGNCQLTGEASGSGHGVIYDALTSGDTALSTRGGQGLYVVRTGTTEKLRLDAAVTYQQAVTSVTTTSALAALPPGIVLAKNAITVTLPAPGNGYKVYIKNIDTSNSVTLAAASGNIDGSSTLTLTAGQSAEVVGDGTNWWVLANR